MGVHLKHYLHEFVIGDNDVSTFTYSMPNSSTMLLQKIYGNSKKYMGLYSHFNLVKGKLLLFLQLKLPKRIAFGRKYEDEGTERSKFHTMLNEVQAMMTAFFVSDYIPFMGWIDKLTGLHARLERNFKELDKFYQDVIDEHMDPNYGNQTDEEVIVDVLLQLKKRRSFSIDLTFDHIKGVLMVCFS
ncbi:Cytochrome P450 superfamily [Sesbania bispinosa]|nr:Cytochrome P450 superfamily [Sesbania bispinosa]